MRSTKITSVTKNPKSRPSLGLFKDSSDDKIKVFDERGFVEELGGLQGPPGPQGNQGTQGEPGPVGPAGLTWRGSWVSGTSYSLNDAVGYNGASYFCIQATSGTSNPTVATTNWALLASQGARGPQGIQGVPGPQGPQGTSGSSGYTENQVQQSSATISSLNFTASGGNNQYNVSVGVQTFTNKLIYKVDLTINVDLVFPNSNDGINGSNPLKFWFEMVPPSGSSFNQFDFFTVHYQSNLTTSNLWYFISNTPAFSIAQGNRNTVGNNNIYLLFQAAAGKLESGIYTIVHHKVTT